MGRTENMSPPHYADLVRCIVAWVQARQAEGTTTDYANIAYKFSLTHAEIDDICGDSEAYGPCLMRHAASKPYSNTTVEVLD